MHVVIAFIMFITLLCYIASIFHVLTRFGLQRSCCRLFRRRVSCVGRCLSLSDAVGVDGLTLSSKPSAVIVLDGLMTYYCNKISFETFDVISVWLHSVINPSSTMCVSITDPGMTLMHRGLTVWGRIATGFTSDFSQDSIYYCGWTNYCWAIDRKVHSYHDIKLGNDHEYRHHVRVK